MVESSASALHVTEECIQAFAGWSGDYSPLHMDPQFARRTRFRGRIAHGMIPVLMLNRLGQLAGDPQIDVESLKVEFRAPVRIGDCIGMVASTDGDARTFTCEWRNTASDKVVASASGIFARRHEPEAQSPAEPSRHFDLADRGIETLDGAGESFRFGLRALADGPLAAVAGGPLSPRMTAVAMLSPLVGMRLPGKPATFSSFELTFDPDFGGASFTLEATVRRCDPLGPSMTADVRISDARGHAARGAYSALVNPPPAAQLPFASYLEPQAALTVPGVALVVGGSRGIGEATARQLAALGAEVFVTYHQGEADAEAICRDIVEGGGKAVAVRCDVTDPQSVRRMINRVQTRSGAPGLLVNCAAYSFAPAPWSSLDWSDFEPELDVTVKGVHEICKAVVPGMREAGGGKIVHLSSVALEAPITGQLRYITGKGALLGYSRALARELAAGNIQVNVVTPTMTETDLVGHLAPEIRRRLAARSATKRHLAPEEIARVIAFLGSTWADAITGQQIVLNLGEPPFL